MNERSKRDEVWGYLGKAKRRGEKKMIEDNALSQGLGDRESYGLVPNQMLNLLLIRRSSLTWFLVILMLEGTLFLILKHWRGGLWLLGLWCFSFLRFLSYSFWCFASWGMLNCFIIIQPRHHLRDGQIWQSESLENPMKKPYIRWQLVLVCCWF